MLIVIVITTVIMIIFKILSMNDLINLVSFNNYMPTASGSGSCLITLWTILINPVDLS